jgi:putative mRNA 3-end processing factor
MPLIEFTDRGLYCRAGDFYIDPWKPVTKAIITHAHSDHARVGSSQYLCHHHTAPLLKLRLGDVSLQQVGWNEIININEVKVSLHPAGHIIGSAQIRVEHKGEVWVVSGDYKTEDDGLSEKFEPVSCNVFITESTFGLPIYKWKSQEEIKEDMRKWVNENMSEGRNSVIIGYSLGKAQRILSYIADMTEKVFVHGAIWNVHQCLVDAGWKLPEVIRITPEMTKGQFKNSIILAPPSADGSPWMKRFTPYRVGVCSGWMQVRGNVRRRNADAGFALSDHADWEGLLSSIRATNAEKIFVTHGFQSAFSRYLTETGLPAYEVKTEYGEEEEEQEKPSTTDIQESQINSADES